MNEMNDLRYAIRQLLKNPGFTAVAVLTLALGIGANTAIFSVINAVMLRPLPFPEQKGLVWIEEASKQDRHEPWGGHYLTWKDHSRMLQDLAAYDSTSMTLTGAGEAERMQVGKASANFFSMLGVQPLPPGRNFSASEDRPGGNRVALLSQELWRQRFGGDPNVVGRTIVLDDVGYTVVGVLPETFRFFQQFDVWTPLALDPQQELTGSIFSYQPAVARPKPGMKPAQVQAELDTLAQRYETLRPGGKPRLTDWQTRLVPLRDYFLGDSLRPLLILLGAVAFVLLIACANVANLLLARAVTRQKELAIRTALGASRLRLTRQMVTECLLLALIGGGAGLLLAHWLVRLSGSLNLADVIGPMAQVAVMDVDPRVFVFATLLSVATGIVFGLLPTFRLAQPNLDVSLREGARGGTAHGKGLRGVLLVGEVALAVVLLAGAGLLMRSFVRLIDVDPGYRPEDLLTAQLRLPPRYEGELKRAQFYDQLLSHVAGLPGVESVGATSQLPLTRYNMGGTLRVKDATEESGKRETAAPITAVNADYFRTMGIGLRAGRLFNDGDGPGMASVAILSESLAKKLFPKDNPAGRQIFVAGTGVEQTTVIGVVDDIRHQGLDHAVEPVAYLNYRQLPRPMMSLVVKTGVAPSSLTSALRAAVSEVDPALPVFDVMTMDARLSKSLAGRRFNLLLLGSFAALALLLAGIGVYGVIAYLVSDRTREVGIRMALGAGRGEVVALVLRHAMTLALIGVVTGVSAAFGLTRLMTTLLFEVKPGDPITSVAVSATLLLVALAASWLPARRASRVDPIEALRCE